MQSTHCIDPFMKMYFRQDILPCFAWIFGRLQYITTILYYRLYNLMMSMFAHAAPQYSAVVVWIIIEFSLWTSFRWQPQSLFWLQYTNVCSHIDSFAKPRSISLFQTIFSSLAFCIWYNPAFIDTITLRKRNWKKAESIRWFVAICHYSKLKYEMSIVVAIGGGFVVVLPRFSWV